MADIYSKSAAQLVQLGEKLNDKDTGAEKALAFINALLTLSERELDEQITDTKLRIIRDEIFELFVNVEDL